VKKKNNWGSIRYKQADNVRIAPKSEIESRAHYAAEPARGKLLCGCEIISNRLYSGVGEFELSQDVVRHIVLSQRVDDEVLVPCRSLARPVLVAFLLHTPTHTHTSSSVMPMSHRPPVAVRAGASLLGRRLPSRVRQHSALSAVS